MKEETPLRDACFQREVITQASPELLASFNQAPVKHSHYFKNVEVLTHIDVYRACLQHAVKKLLVAGGRGAGKDISQDVREAIETLERWEAMRAEDMPISRVTTV